MNAHRAPFERRTLYGLAVLFLLPFTPHGTSWAQLGTYRLGEVIALRTLEIAEARADTFEQVITEREYPFFDDRVAGIDVALLVGDRGMEAGKYLYMYLFDSEERRNYYFPTEDGPFPIWEPISISLNEVSGDIFEAAKDVEFTGDFVLVGPETVPELPWVDLLGIHRLKVRPQMEVSFEFFVREEWNRQAHIPGLWRLFYKADRGVRKGEYIVVYAFENRLLRDALWPQQETLSDLADWIFRPAYAGTLQEYFEPTEVDEYTDWVMLR